MIVRAKSSATSKSQDPPVWLSGQILSALEPCKYSVSPELKPASCAGQMLTRAQCKGLMALHTRQPHQGRSCETKCSNIHDCHIAWGPPELDSMCTPLLCTPAALHFTPMAAVHTQTPCTPTVFVHTHCQCVHRDTVAHITYSNCQVYSCCTYPRRQTTHYPRVSSIASPTHFQCTLQLIPVARWPLTPCFAQPC